MEKAIAQTKLLIAEQYDDHEWRFSSQLSEKNFDKYHRPYYLFTNENIDAYLKAANIKSGSKALSVLASGDQAFNLIANGIKDIDTFDINKLTEYYVFGLKMALILKCNYQEFTEAYSKLLCILTSPEEIMSIIRDSLPYMYGKYRIYWTEILDFYNKLNKESELLINIICILEGEKINADKIKQANTYLKNELNYNIFKTNLLNSNMSYKFSNMLDLPQNFKKEYDYILLSNILDYVWLYWGDYWDKNQLDAFTNSLNPILNENGIIFLHYCFFKHNYMRFSKISRYDLLDYDAINFKGVLSDKTEHMILKRKKEGEAIISWKELLNKLN